MRYRNDTGGPLTLTTEPPCTVLPGWTVDADVHIAGLTRIDEDGTPIVAGTAEAVGQVGPDAPTPGTDAAAPPADTSVQTVPLSEVHIEPPADWQPAPANDQAPPADDQAPAGEPAAHQVAAAVGVAVDPNQDAGGDQAGPETTAGELPAADQQ